PEDPAKAPWRVRRRSRGKSRDCTILLSFPSRQVYTHPGSPARGLAGAGTSATWTRLPRRAAGSSVRDERRGSCGSREGEFPYQINGEEWQGYREGHISDIQRTYSKIISRVIKMLGK